MSANSYDALWLAIGHLRAAKTQIGKARYGYRALPPAIDDLLGLKPREILKIEQALIALSRSIADQTQPAKPKRSAPRRAA